MCFVLYLHPRCFEIFDTFIFDICGHLGLGLGTIFLFLSCRSLFLTSGRCLGRMTALRALTCEFHGFLKALSCNVARGTDTWLFLTRLNPWIIAEKVIVFLMACTDEMLLISTFFLIFILFYHVFFNNEFPRLKLNEIYDYKINIPVDPVMYLNIVLASTCLHHPQTHLNPNLYCLLDFTARSYFKKFKLWEAKKNPILSVQFNSAEPFKNFKYFIH